MFFVHQCVLFVLFHQAFLLLCEIFENLGLHSVVVKEADVIHKLFVRFKLFLLGRDSDLSYVILDLHFSEILLHYIYE